MNQISRQQFLTLIYDVIGTEDVDTSRIESDKLIELNQKIMVLQERDKESDDFKLILTAIRLIVCDMVVDLNPDIIPVSCNETVEDYIYRMCNLSDDIESINTTGLYNVTNYKDKLMLFNSSGIISLVTMVKGELSDDVVTVLNKFSLSVTETLAGNGSLESDDMNEILVSVIASSDYIGYKKAIIDFILSMSKSLGDILVECTTFTHSMESELKTQLLTGIEDVEIFDILSDINDILNSKYNAGITLTNEMSIDDIAGHILMAISMFHNIELRCRTIGWIVTMPIDYHYNMVKGSIGDFINVITEKYYGKESEQEDDDMEIKVADIVDEETELDSDTSSLLEELADMIGINNTEEDDAEEFNSDGVITSTIRSNLVTRVEQLLTDLFSDKFKDSIQDTTDSECQDSVCNCISCNSNVTKIGNRDKKPVARGTYSQLLLHLTFDVKKFANTVLNDMNVTNTYSSVEYYTTVLNVVETVICTWCDIYSMTGKKFNNLDLDSFDAIKCQLTSIYEMLNRDINEFDLNDAASMFTILKLMALDLLSGLCQMLYDFIVNGNKLNASSFTICDVIYNLSNIRTMEEWLD